ncbi:isochorismatase family cysteine hydrolase [Pandoraea pnomenusa]|uniref:isochorismatase family cysteine hydrolase n=1 Tax=Pandoraea pnomenusa TaxID=93220 RepID=UPI0033418E5B
MSTSIAAGPVDSAGKTDAMLVPEKTALLVMHYQTDILSLFPDAAPALLANTRALCDAARAKRVPIYFAQFHFSPGYPEISPMNRNGQGVKSLGRFVEDTISPELAPQADEPVIMAHRASAFYGTDLQVRLSARGIDTLIMVGVASTGVMLSSVAHASDADYRLFTVKDCCFDPDPVVHDRLFATAFASRTQVLSLTDALAMLA